MYWGNSGQYLRCSSVLFGCSHSACWCSIHPALSNSFQPAPNVSLSFNMLRGRHLTTSIKKRVHILTLIISQQVILNCNMTFLLMISLFNFEALRVFDSHTPAKWAVFKCSYFLCTADCYLKCSLRMSALMEEFIPSPFLRTEQGFNHFKQEESTWLHQIPSTSPACHSTCSPSLPFTISSPAPLLFPLLIPLASACALQHTGIWDNVRSLPVQSPAGPLWLRLLHKST